MIINDMLKQIDWDFLFAAITLVSVWSGIYVALRHFKLQAMRDQFEMYLQSEMPVTEEQIGLATSVPEEYFDMAVYKAKYKGERDKIGRYLAMVRRYHYALYSVTARNQLKGPFQVNYDLWVSELCSIDEFRDVHNRYKRYYPGFRDYIDRQIEKPPSTA